MQVDYIRDLTYAGPYFSKKHVAEPAGFGIGGWGNLTANNFRIMRLGHIKLFLAEAYVETGRLEEARAQINDLRRRAANPDGFEVEAIQGASRQEYTTTSNDYLARESKYRIYLKGMQFSSPKNEFYPIPSYAIDRSFLEGEPTLTQDPNY